MAIKAMAKAFHVDEDKYGIPNMTETRYVLVDTDTGEIVDDAQGYGYDTAQKAQRAYRYKYLKKAV